MKNTGSSVFFAATVLSRWRPPSSSYFQWTSTKKSHRSVQETPKW